ncbi:Uncharacterised protein [Amycolatopsis camponoti]|uniref:Uncharacterized protein n=2 Tax=Amycolatopsis camponoti TaxID=2606593 RepID=A0A6I8M501_9PSEU|nr:Uncharacterised protein [Amycolatopsis camponoti]
MENPGHPPVPASEQGQAAKLAAIEPMPGSYWAMHEIVKRSPDEVRRGEAPAYVRRIRREASEPRDAL